MKSRIETLNFVTVDELAELLVVPRATIYRWSYAGTGPRAFKVGRHLRFRVVDVETWIERQAIDRAGSPKSRGRP